MFSLTEGYKILQFIRFPAFLICVPTAFAKVVFPNPGPLLTYTTTKVFPWTYYSVYGNSRQQTTMASSGYWAGRVMISLCACCSIVTTVQLGHPYDTPQTSSHACNSMRTLQDSMSQFII